MAIRPYEQMIHSQSASALKDKVAVVTGSGRGIGRAIALAFTAEGAKVVVNSRPSADGAPGTAQRVVEESRMQGGTAVSIFESVATMEGAQKIIQSAVDNFGRLDILVNNAAITRHRIVYNMTEADWDEVIAVNLKGTFACTKYAAAIMRKQRSGRVINLCSESGLMGVAGQASYGASKGGISGLTRALAKELGKYGITVNCIVPRAATDATYSAPVLPPGTRPLSQSPFDDLEGSFAELGWMPEDVAPMAIYLASDAAASINGQFFLVYDGDIHLLTQPHPIRTIYKDGTWTVNELSKVVPKALMKGVINPAPAIQTS